MRVIAVSALLLLSLQLGACSVTSEKRTVRFATFNAAMGLAGPGELQDRLRSGQDPALKALATILQSVRPDVVLLNEFDRQEDFDNARHLLTNYLHVSQDGDPGIDYRWSYQGAVNTGVDSELDLDGDGETGGPGDAWGYGSFPGQYGMLVLSRFPIDYGSVRTFRHFHWRDMPGALKPVLPGEKPYYPAATWRSLRLSSKSHWDLPIKVNGHVIHFLASHPTPPVFDGPEDRNGRRNHDEIRMWADYVSDSGDYLVDDSGLRGGLGAGEHFVIAGDQNSDPLDGDSSGNPIWQLLNHPAIDAGCQPASEGGAEAAQLQGGVNAGQQGDPALDTSDFSDRYTGNLRLDYVLPSSSLRAVACGVFWPTQNDPRTALTQFSDHRLVWLDTALPGR